MPATARAALNGSSDPRAGGWFEDNQEPSAVTKIIIPASTEIKRVIACQFTDGFVAK